MLTLVYLLKFMHIIFALSLLGTAVYCIVAVGFKKKSNLRLNKILLLLSVFALLTGSLLVIPKHYSFTTPWIQAAYILVLLFGLLVSGLLVLKKKMWLNHPTWWLLSYLFLTALLIIIIHDAVTKSTFLL
ncbi:MAG: hypothetical protein P4M14_09720 [Gammaproteobacteria bacterium]|nr:hypothetical protein [Gammaproteobacteria bacterium]